MKRIIFRVIVLTVLLTGFFCNNTMAEEKTELFSKDVTNLKSFVELDKLFLSWELKDISDVATVEILLKESTSQKYRKSAEVKPEVCKFEKKFQFL